MTCTKRQLDVLSAIRDYRHRTGCQPRLHDIAKSMSISRTTVFEHLSALRDKRLIRWLPYKARSIEVITDVGRRERMKLVFPIVGTIGGGRIRVAK